MAEEGSNNTLRSSPAHRRRKFLWLTIIVILVFCLGAIVGSTTGIDPASFSKLVQIAGQDGALGIVEGAARQPQQQQQQKQQQQEQQQGEELVEQEQQQEEEQTLPQEEDKQNEEQQEEGQQQQQLQSQQPAVAAAVEEVHLRQTTPKSKGFVKKTFFDDKVRFLFVAGIEGSGHHAWQTIFWACWKEDSICHVPQKLQKVLYNNKTWGLFNPITPKFTVHKRDWVAQREKALELFKSAKEAYDHQVLGILNVAEYIADVGEMSYPNFIHGPERSLRKPDLHLLAGLAEEAGVDLRIMVLTRAAAGIYHSTVTHRHFMPGLPQTMVLIDNAHSLLGQLMSIDPRFVRCVSNYGTSPTVEERATEIASFIHPAFANEKKGLWQRLLAKVTEPSAAPETVSPVDRGLIQRVQAATDLIDGYCATLP